MRIFKDLVREMHHPERGTIRDVDGTGAKPLHVLSRATEEVFDPYDPLMSGIFQVPFKKFQSYTAVEVQNIFKDRHILIYDVPPDPKWKWSLECLEELCPGGVWIEVQGIHIHIKCYHSHY